MTKFTTIPKKPKDKHRVIVNDQTLGYIDFSFQDRQYYFKSEFDKQLTADICSDIATKIQELNSEIK